MSDVGEDPALIGRTIAGKFVIEKFLGGGAMGAVYRAHNTVLDKVVAMKVMHREVATDEQFAARFHREAKAASRLNHPNSMAVLDFGAEPDGLLYIAMEYLQGRDLYKVIHEDWPLSDARIVDVLSQALAAIAVAHDMGVIHRDLKPENIMIVRGKDDDGRDADLVKVCDFGIAKIQEPEGSPATSATVAVAAGARGPSGTAPLPEGGKKLTTTGLVIGTPEYMSPEQARGEKLDARSDLYSMGVILYQLLTGRTPFVGDTALAVVLKHITEQPAPPRTIYANVNQALEAACIKAMAKGAADRFQTAREMRSAVRAAVDGARPTPVDVTAPTIGAPISSPAITASVGADTAPTIAGLPPPTTNAGVGSEIAPAPPARRNGVAFGVALFAIVAGAAGGFAYMKARSDPKPDGTTSPSVTAAKNVEPPTTSTSTGTSTSTSVAPTVSVAQNSATPAKHEARGPKPPPGKHAGTEPPPPPPPGPVPEPPPVTPPPPVEPPPAVAPPVTTQAPPPPPSLPAAFNPGTCRASQGNVVPHGVSKNDLTMKGTVDAWTACARSSIKEKPPGPINATVHLMFSDSRTFRGATCAGCPGPLAQCIGASTGKTVSVQFKSGDVTGDPSFDVGVTFSCD